MKRREFIALFSGLMAAGKILGIPRAGSLDGFDPAATEGKVSFTEVYCSDGRMWINGTLQMDPHKLYFTKIMGESPWSQISNLDGQGKKSQF
jgi:hypothetical protein